MNFRLRGLRGLLLANNLSLDLCWVPSWANPSDRTIRIFTRLASGGPLSRCFLASCTSPQKLFLKLRIEVDRLLEPLGKGAITSLQRLREKQGIAVKR